MYVRNIYTKMSESRALRKARWESVERGLEVLTAGNSRIGSGVYGEVTKYTYHGTPVAVKKIKAREGMGMSERYNLQLALEREMGLLTRLRHPNIVNIIASTENSIVMELFDGSLGKIESLGDMAFVARECTRALAYMQGHDECTFHGDIKPDNILVNRSQDGAIARVVLGDVGISRECSVGNEFLGTPGFMPHPLNGEINSLTDLFGLGVSLLRSYFGENVHAAYPPDLADNTLDFVSRLPPDFGEILAKMISAYKNKDLSTSRGVRVLFIKSIISEWDIVLAGYRREEMYVPTTQFDGDAFFTVSGIP